MLGSILCALLIGSIQGLNVKRVVEQKDAAEASQAMKCENIYPAISCMSKSYNWGIVWLHGLGNGKMSKYNQNVILPQVLSVTGMPWGSGIAAFPQAPQAFVTSDNMVEQSWHDQILPYCNVSFQPPHHGYSLEDGLKNVPLVHAQIQRLMDLGIPSNKIMVAGHSQGGSMVYLSAMKFKKPLLGAINLSGGLLGWGNINKNINPEAANVGIPMLWLKGDSDQVVPQEHQNEIVPMLKLAGYQPELQYFKGGHSLDTDPQIVGQLADFINRQLIYRAQPAAYNNAPQMAAAMPAETAPSTAFNPSPAISAASAPTGQSSQGFQRSTAFNPSPAITASAAIGSAQAATAPTGQLSQGFQR